MKRPYAISAAAILIGILPLLAAGCTAVPKGLRPVPGFEVDRYLGKWYEIARLDHSFERGLSRVTAEYSKNDDGSIRVVNQGFDEKENAWKRIEGRALFIGDEQVGSLKVSFFGPFYSGYHVIALDSEDYRYALVSGATRSYLWILARTPRLDPALVNDLVAVARRGGFDTDRLIFVDQSPVPKADGS